jgi:hypothetical protein
MFKHLNAKLLIAALLLALNATVQAAVDTDLQGIVNDSSSLFGLVKTLMITILVFLIGWRIVKKIK